MDARMPKTVDGIEDFSSPPEWDERSWCAVRDVNQEIAVANINLSYT